ncbi:MAG: phosphate signaling complex protein PhoU [Desulfitobacteriaceae bacterium]|nr:phosphate signaling complex protein PhoU [Desulfitobacteriaceae bacterium]MDI6913617.1 phosphate signaling complex protein PhoU [Desulfitobacteriaceae bacterium]
MRQSLEEGLAILVGLLGQMGQEVDAMLHGAIVTLTVLDQMQAKHWILHDELVNALELQVNEECVRLIVTQQPVARDVRKIVSAMKIATDLERMADLAVGIAKVVNRIEGPLIKPLIDVPKMADLAIQMIQQGLKAYELEDVSMAGKLAELDDEIDHLYKMVVKELLMLMGLHPEMTNQGMQLSFVARYIERIADHATNIGEHVFYIATGERKDLND